MEVSPHLIISRLIIQGARRNYEVKFEEGLNLIWGDMDSGKSSILNLIDYCLGGKNDTFLYGEMKRNGRIAFLEIDLNGKIFTFERDILSDSSAIRVYSGLFESRSLNFPLLMAASSTDKMMPDGWVSDFILNNLGIARVSIKESRFRDDADSDRLSFRDLMKLMYLKQTRVGSDALLDSQSPTLFNKNVEIQKFVYNIYDDQLSGLNSELTKEVNELADLEKNERFIQKFLRDVNIDVAELKLVGDAVEEQETQLAELDNSLAAMKNDFALSTDVGMVISSAVAGLRTQLKDVVGNLSDLELRYDNFVKLGNTYRFDLDALHVSRLSRSLIHPLHESNGIVPCPLCASNISVVSPIVEDSDLDNQIRSIKNRAAGIESVLSNLRLEQARLQKEKARLHKAISDASRSFDENNISSISPLITSIHAIEISRTQVKLELAEAERNHSIANKYFDIGSRIEVKSLIISKLRRAIKIIQEGLIGLDQVVEELSALFIAYMGRSALQNAVGAFLDNKFVAHFRDMSYYVTSSGGVRTIMSIGIYLTRMEFLLLKQGNLPTFLMIDTPGQNIGRYRKSDDNSEVSDPKLYENIFKQIVDVTTRAAEAGRKCQVIVVDNDIPDLLVDGVNFHLVKRFSKKGGEFDKGLISDA